jgi:hypothetical protein
LKNITQIILICSLLFHTGCSQKDFNIVKNNEPITELDMKISSEAGLKYVTTTDKIILDSLTRALRESIEIDPDKGGIFDIWADCKIYKGKKEADFFVQLSPYHGWYVEIDNKALECKYLFDLVKNNKLEKKK